MAGPIEKAMPTIQKLATGLAMTTPEGSAALERYGWYKWLTARPEILKEAEKGEKAKLMLEALKATGGRPTPQMLAVLARYGIEWPKERVELPGIKKEALKSRYFKDLTLMPEVSIPPTTVERPRAVPSPLAGEEAAMQRTLLDIFGRMELEKLRQKVRKPTEFEVFARSLGYPNLQDLTREQARDLLTQYKKYMGSERTWPADLWLYAKSLGLDKKLKNDTLSREEAEALVKGYHGFSRQKPRKRELDIISLSAVGKTADQITSREEADKVIKLLQQMRRQDLIALLSQLVPGLGSEEPKGLKFTGQYTKDGRPVYAGPDGKLIAPKGK